MVVTNLTNAWRILRNILGAGKRESPASELTGAPIRLRIKTYSADSGYAYQHVYRGQRNLDAATEYVFSVSAKPGELLTLTVQLHQTVIGDWERENGRTLTATQKYAIAKMTMFEFFDETGPGFSNVSLAPDLSAVQRYLEQLNLA
jgi:hypothetical protein